MSGLLSSIGNSTMCQDLAQESESSGWFGILVLGFFGLMVGFTWGTLIFMVHSVAEKLKPISVFVVDTNMDVTTWTDRTQATVLVGQRLATQLEPLSPLPKRPRLDGQVDTVTAWTDRKPSDGQALDMLPAQRLYPDLSRLSPLKA